MVIPINSANIQPIKPRSEQPKTNSVSGDDFKNLFKTTSAEMYAYVPEALAPYKEGLKKKRIPDDPLWNMEDEEETDNVRTLLKKIDERLKKLRKLSEDVN